MDFILYQDINIVFRMFRSMVVNQHVPNVQSIIYLRVYHYILLLCLIERGCIIYLTKVYDNTNSMRNKKKSKKVDFVQKFQFHDYLIRPICVDLSRVCKYFTMKVTYTQDTFRSFLVAPQLLDHYFVQTQRVEFYAQ